MPTRLKSILVSTACVLFCGDGAESCGQNSVSQSQVAATIRKATAFYHDKLAVQGGYVYYYSTDLSVRWGEGLASEDQIWVQPPGTPTVGMALLNAYKATDDNFYLDAAQAAAEALLFGQRQSGGWSNSVDMKGRRSGYRFEGGKQRMKGISSLDDDQTQSAIQLLIRIDEAMEFNNAEVHQGAMMALDALLAAQFANGAFPQVWKAAATQQPVLKAGYPDYDWRTEGRVKNYWDMYTLNDNVCGNVADVLVTAHQVYRDDRYLTSLKRLGDFLILAQMPEPQPAWAQQYNYQMHPIWARKFEPPAVSGDETQEVIDTLMMIAAATNDAKYLQPIPAALSYLKRSLLLDGRLSRYYELKTNKPLYMTRRGKLYELTYDDSNLPAHYGWKWDSRIGELERKYKAFTANAQRAVTQSVIEPSEIRRIVSELDDEGRWLSTYNGERLAGQPKFAAGSRYISSEVFHRNITLLSNYLNGLKKQPSLN